MTELMTNYAEKESQQLAQKELLDLKLALDFTSIVAQTDLAGTITYVNDKFCEISQYSRDELIGQNHSLLNSGVHPKSIWTEMYRVASKGQPWSYEVCNCAKDGSLYWVDTTVIGFFDNNNKLDHYIAIRTDITRR
ncbi:MAG: PAS domain-containing protein, partial [Methylophaga sp.]|nr:PAS domain-containing protein [Methylophaga sp.]